MNTQTLKTQKLNTHAMASTDDGPGAGERALRWIGDLDHPFYNDERNRHVWYEASAIGFQMLFLANYFVTGLMLLVFGAPVLLYAVFFLAPTVLTSVVFQSWLSQHSAEYWPGLNDLRRRRGQFGVAAGVVLLMGLVRASVDLQASGEGPLWSFAEGTREGLIGGILVGPIAAVIVIALKRRAQDRAAELDEDV